MRKFMKKAICECGMWYWVEEGKQCGCPSKLRITATPPGHITRGGKRVRHCMSRYAFREDRKDFRRWVNAPGPGPTRYWRCEVAPARIIITLFKGERFMCYALTFLELEMARHGWRWIVAHAVRQVRHALTASEA